ncbi:transposase [Flavobacterium sp. XN-5]|nr:transposase [Flavobacterium sp. XN-5]
MDINIFQSLDQVREETQKWFIDYNYFRPHDALEGKSAIEYVDFKLSSNFKNSNLI